MQGQYSKSMPVTETHTHTESIYLCSFFIRAFKLKVKHYEVIVPFFLFALLFL